MRDLETGSEKVYPAGGAPMGFPISHLSWAPSGATILVSVGPAQRNTGWFLSVLNVATSRSYLPANWYSYLPLNQSAADVLAVPVTGKPDAARSYYREGVYLPDGNMFVDRMCCAGVPGTVTSTLLQEVSASGRLIRQVAMGFNDRDHTSLDASGGLLLYLSAHDLYVSDSGRPASKLTTGLIAAAWLPS